ncbi:MAG: NAD(P)/FAD-dependent oxidoreductase [Cryobacterium sp.]|nr:NAD(P)/FAD-dependent oxidoreductase [Cryobacterium sp.]
MTDGTDAAGRFDVVVIGAGPAGLSAALNLARSRHTVAIFDSNRPRNAATMASHGFLSRDGISPLELRKLGLAEALEYPSVTHRRALVDRVVRTVGGEADIDDARERFTIVAAGETVTARIVVTASGLRETLPALPSIRAFYGTSLHSCLVCDGYEKRDQPLALIGESDDLAQRALLVSRWSDDLVVFTNGVGEVSETHEVHLAERGIRVERRPIADVVGDRNGLTGIELADGEVVPRSAGFIRPRYETALDYLAELEVARDAEGYVTVDGHGRTSVPWLYAAGDLTPPGPKQLIVAAGAGAMVAGGINRDELLGWPALAPSVE